MRAGTGQLVSRMVQSAVFLAAAASLLQAQSPKLTEDERSTIAVVQRASAGVVHIESRSMMETKFEKHVAEVATGSGFVIDPEGRILTAFHLIKDKNQIDVVLGDGKRLPARIVGAAPTLDLALLQIDVTETKLNPLVLGDSDTLQVGQKVIAIGNPMGLHNTVTAGIVSAVRRSVEELPVELQDALIQTDAPINPGNSGGPLLNSAGEVIGVNDAVVSQAQNLGLAVPINFAKRVIPDLIAMGHPYRPQLGFSGSEITRNVARLFGLPVEQGFLVEEVLPGSQAALAGLRAGNRIIMLGDKPHVLGGDIVTGVNGKPVTSPSDIAHALLESHPGQVLTLDVYREGRTIEIAMPLLKMQMRF